MAGLCSLLAANRRAADAPELRPRVGWPAQRYAAGVDACLAVASERDQRRYVERPVSEDGVSWILDAGGIAGSAKNGQPWRSLLLGNRGLVYQVAQTVCVSPNVLLAPLLIAVVVSGKDPVAFDPGRAAQNMMLAAGNEGVVSAPNGIASPDSLAGPFGTRGG